MHLSNEYIMSNVHVQMGIPWYPLDRPLNIIVLFLYNLPLSGAVLENPVRGS